MADLALRELASASSPWLGKWGARSGPRTALGGQRGHRCWAKATVGWDCYHRSCMLERVRTLATISLRTYGLAARRTRRNRIVALTARPTAQSVRTAASQ